MTIAQSKSAMSALSSSLYFLKTRIDSMISSGEIAPIYALKPKDAITSTNIDTPAELVYAIATAVSAWEYLSAQ